MERAFTSDDANLTYINAEEYEQEGWDDHFKVAKGQDA